MSRISNSIRTRLISGGAWALAGRGLILLSGLAVNAMLARMLSLDEMGAYFLGIAVVNVAVMLGQFGLNQSVVRMISVPVGEGRPEQAKAAVLKAFVLSGIGAIIVAGALTLGLGRWVAEDVVHSPLLQSVLSLVAVWTILQNVQNLLAETFRSYHDVRLAGAFGGVISNVALFTMVAISYFLGMSGNLRTVMIFNLVAFGISAFIGMVLLMRKLKGTMLGTISWRAVLLGTLPLFLYNICFVLTQSDLWILAVFRPNHEVAVYGAAARLVNLVGMPLVLVNAFLPPILAELYAQRNMQSLERVCRVTATIAGIPTLIMTGILAISGAYILGLVYGPAYTEGYDILLWLSVGQLVTVWTGSCSYALLVAGYQKVMMWVLVFSAAITIALSLTLVREHGGPGVAFATMVGALLQNIAMLAAAKYLLGVWTHGSLRVLVLQVSPPVEASK